MLPVETFRAQSIEDFLNVIPFFSHINGQAKIFSVKLRWNWDQT